MNITIKQREIQTALLNYIAQQGITLAGKEVAITFTAGRKEAGITAELVIEDSDLPDFSEDVAQDRAAISIPINRVDVSEAEPVPAEAEEVVSEVEDAAPAIKTNSLFG